MSNKTNKIDKTTVATVQSCKEKFMSTEAIFNRVRGASDEGARAANTALEESMRQFLERFNGIVENLTIENGALKARLDAVESTARTKAILDETRIRILEERVSLLEERLTSTKQVADSALQKANHHRHGLPLHDHNPGDNPRYLHVDGWNVTYSTDGFTAGPVDG